MPLPSMVEPAPAEAVHRLVFWESLGFVGHRILGFVQQGLADGCGVVVLARTRQLAELRRLAAGTLDAAQRDGRLLLVDSDETYRGQLLDGQPAKARFISTLQGALAKVAAPGRPLRFFGDMVEVACEQGRFDVAVQFESWCHEIAKSEAGRLEALCAYPFSVLATPEVADVFRSICSWHTGEADVEGYPADAPREDRLAYILRLQNLLREVQLEAQSRRAAEEALRQHRDNLELLVRERTRMMADANRELEAFSYSVSHDLQAPLRALQGLSHLLIHRHGHELSPEAAEMLQEIGRSAVRMGSLIDGLLQLSSLNAAPLAARRVDVTAMARGILADLARRDPERRVATHVEDGIEVHADPTLLSVLLENLLANAWKYTGRREDATIEVTRARAADGRGASVADNGVGFDEGQASRLFHPFERLHGAQFEGRGIGLATVRRIVRRHGGQVWAEGSPGRGAKFTFILPQPDAAELHIEGPNLARHEGMVHLREARSAESHGHLRA